MKKRQVEEKKEEAPLGPRKVGPYKITPKREPLLGEDKRRRVADRYRDHLQGAGKTAPVRDPDEEVIRGKGEGPGRRVLPLPEEDDDDVS